MGKKFLVEVQELDLEIAERERPAKQDVVLIALHVVEREGRVFLEVDFAVDQDRLAAGALAFLAAMRDGDPLAERRVQNRLVLFDLHLDANRLEAYVIDLFRAHQISHPLLASSRAHRATGPDHRGFICNERTCLLVFAFGERRLPAGRPT